MKVTVVSGYQLRDKNGKVHNSGTVDMDDVEAQQAITAGYAKKPSTQKAQTTSANKAQKTAPNKAQTPKTSK